jgi:hypothetical protein
MSAGPSSSGVSGYDPTCCGEAALIEHIQRRVMGSLEQARSVG